MVRLVFHLHVKYTNFCVKYFFPSKMHGGICTALYKVDGLDWISDDRKVYSKIHNEWDVCTHTKLDARKKIKGLRYRDKDKPKKNIFHVNNFIHWKFTLNLQKNYGNLDEPATGSPPGVPPPPPPPPPPPC